jgi:hypothetical protein
MNFFAVGSNKKDSIKGTISPSEGDKALCDPGVNECSSFLLECFNNNIPSDGLFSRFDDQKKAVNFLNGLNSTQFSPGVVRRFVEATGCTVGTELHVSHPPDISNKRFVEAWKIPYPSVELTPTVQSVNTPVLVASDKFALKPLIYPEEVQSLTIPPGTGDFLLSPWLGIQMYNNGEKVVLYSNVAVIVLEWDGVGYSQVLLHQTGTVYKASVYNNSAIVTYNDGTNKIAFYEKAGTWALSSTLSWSYSQSDVALNGSYILVGGTQQAGITLNKSDLSVYHAASNTNYIATIPTQAYKYPADPSVVVGYDTEYITAGGYTTQKLVYTQYYTSSESMQIFYDAYRPEGQTNVRFYSPIFLRHPYMNDPYSGFVMKTSHGELFTYDYLHNWYSAPLDIGLPDSYSGYLFDQYMVGFFLPSTNDYRVLWAYGNEELIDLYSYNSVVHKKFGGVFYPVKYPYYLTNNLDGTLKLLRIVPTHYNEIGDGVLTLKFECPELISSTESFVSGYNGLETCKFLISDDDVVFWKWVAPNWVVESNPSLGNDISTFTAGCEAGFAPLNSKVVYMKVFLSSASKDTTPSLVRSDISLTVNYLSRSGKAVLCDDSRVSINFESPTSTKITSHDPGVYAMAGVVTVFAPPIDTNLDV